MTTSSAPMRRPASRPANAWRKDKALLQVGSDGWSSSTNAPGPGLCGRWDVRRAKVFGVCAPTTGIEPYHRLVDLVMGQEPYRSARRVFWIGDNGSSHRGEASKQRLASGTGTRFRSTRLFTRVG